MFSDDVHYWEDYEVLLEPEAPWEYIQIGNCGSPLETEAGWLVLTHGVGAMRNYCIGAALLDRDDPRRVIGRLRQPAAGAALAGAALCGQRLCDDPRLAQLEPLLERLIG